MEPAHGIGLYGEKLAAHEFQRMGAANRTAVSSVSSRMSWRIVPDRLSERRLPAGRARNVPSATRLNERRRVPLWLHDRPLY